MGLTPASGGGPMAAKMAENIIRLARHGCTNRPFFHIVVMKADLELKEQPIEQLGVYDPLPNIYGEKLCSLNIDRINHWVKEGVSISTNAQKLLGYAGLLPLVPELYMHPWPKPTKLDGDLTPESYT